jgi:hypothetical protein
VLEGVGIDATVEGLCACARDGPRSPGTGPLHAACHAVGGTALHPCAESGIGQGAGRRDGVAVVASTPRTDGGRPAQDARLLGLRQHGLSRRQGIITNVAFEGAPRWAPWRRMTVILHVTAGQTLLIGAKWLRLKFSRCC